jgi:transposase
LSRGGKSRKKEAEKAHDHDTKWDAKLKPVGISDVVAGFLMIVFANSPETSDLIADSITMWWERNRESYYHIKELVINLDNGPHNSSHRTQFIKRMVELSDKTGLRIRLVYYPPYHSKYNPVERCWGVLERHRNGTILNSIEKTINWAETMTWKGIGPVVDFIDKIYEKGVVLTKKEMKKYDERLDRSIELPKYDVRIEPQFG